VDRADGSDPEDADAQYRLGLRYLDGDGVAADAAQAIRWFRRAAKQGHAYAQHDLAWCYHHGHGIVADPAREFAWVQRAAEQGLPDAAFAVGSAYQHERGVANDLRQALYWMERAHAQVPRARRQVRILRWKLHPILRYSHRAMWVAGLALLAHHAVTVPFSFRWQAVALYVGIVAAAAVGTIVVSSLLGYQAFDKEVDEHGLLIRRARRGIGAERLRGWAVPGAGAPRRHHTTVGDHRRHGVRALPLSVVLAAELPPEGARVHRVALFVLPSRIWSALAGHIIVDAIRFGSEALFRRQSRSGGG
jgi:hypothetical protein